MGDRSEQYIGKKYGRLTVLRKTEDRSACNRPLYECVCDCGTTIKILINRLTQSRTRSCGCLKKDVNRQPKGLRTDYTGRRFGRLVVVGKTDETRYSKPVWELKCDCGNMVRTVSSQLVSGKTRSCGCLRVDDVIERITVHGDSGYKRRAEYGVWIGMKRRCYNKNDSHYHLYGGRGIVVCDRWHDYVSFLEDMGRRPSPDHSIERLDSNGNYSPDNCKWGTTEEQANNKRNSLRVTHEGRTLTVAQWARAKGFHPQTLYRRYYAGKRGDELFAPPDTKYGKWRRERREQRSQRSTCEGEGGKDHDCDSESESAAPTAVSGKSGRKTRHLSQAVR